MHFVRSEGHLFVLARAQNLMVRVDGFEPPATRSQGECASWLRYTRTNLDCVFYCCVHGSCKRQASVCCMQCLVAAPGIEPDSLVLQTSAFT
jgi:hypothetical protein